MSYWFRPKRYGYGATPNSWQGWLLTLGFVALLAGILSLAEAGGGGSPTLLAATVILAALFVLIVWKKTEGAWRWRWGSNEKER